VTISTEKITNVKLYRMSTPEHDCPWGRRAVDLLTEREIPFEDIKLRSPAEIATFKAKYGVATTPQIFFGAERIGGYTDLAERFEVKAQTAEYSYTPVIALFSTAGLMTLATSLGMPGFMGISLSMLASLKFMDLKSFTESFEKYDAIAKRYKLYGKAYPFAELAIALGFLSGIAPLATGVGAVVVGVSGAVSVFKAVYIDKMALNCACLGGNSKAPLGVVSFAENAIMAGMGAILTFSSLTGTAVEFRQPSAALPAGVSMNRDSINRQGTFDRSSMEHKHTSMDLGPADKDYELRSISKDRPKLVCDRQKASRDRTKSGYYLELNYVRTTFD
jgi:glutaredoxin